MSTMVKTKSDRIYPGAVISIPVRDGTVAIGQVIVGGTVFYFAVDPRERNLHCLVGDDIDICSLDINFRIFSWTNDAEVYRGNWKILSVCDIYRSRVNMPEYIVNVEGVIQVESFDGKNIRDFCKDKDSDLAFRKASSPLLIQDAVRSFNGIGEWESWYDDFLD